MQSTNNLKAKEGKLTLIAFLTFLWPILFLCIPYFYFYFDSKSLYASVGLLEILEFYKEKSFFSPEFISSSLFIIIPLIIFLITLAIQNPFTKRKFLDFFVLTSTLWMLFCIFVFISFLTTESTFASMPLFYILYLPVCISYLSIRKPFVKKKKNNAKFSSEKIESGISINVYMHR